MLTCIADIILYILLCSLQTENANRVFAYVKAHRGKLPLRHFVTRSNAAGEMMVMLSLSPVDVQSIAGELMQTFSFVKSVYACRLAFRPAHALDGKCIHLAGAQTLTETLCGLTFSVSPQSFFQVNHEQTEILYRTALSFAQLTPQDEIADVYCGAGTISLAAARECKHVTGIEIVPEAIRDANLNARVNHLENKTTFLCADAAQAYPALQKKHAFSAVIVDPPRKGLDASVTESLIASPASRLVYVSCNPATLARDVKLLTSSGAYRFITAQPVDMFPKTEHVETVVLLSRR